MHHYAGRSISAKDYTVIVHQYASRVNLNSMLERFFILFFMFE